MATLHAQLPIVLGLALALAAGCREVPRPEDENIDPFKRTGAIIALGGGDGGVRHACARCHGLNGEGDGVMAPRLAGLDAGYLAKQLIDYADGRRPDPVMGVIARALDGPAISRVAAHYAALPVPAMGVPAMGVPQPAARVLPEPPDPAIAALYARGDTARGIAACAGCHGIAGEGRGPNNPPLAGQPAAYLAEQLARWHRAERRNDPNDVMLRQAQRLRPDEQQALAAYAASLPGTAARPTATPVASGTAPSRPAHRRDPTGGA